MTAKNAENVVLGYVQKMLDDLCLNAETSAKIVAEISLRIAQKIEGFFN